MNPKWHIAFCNVTYTEYAAMTYRDYYGSPANTLQAQLTAKALMQERYGVGNFITPHVDTPSATFPSYLGMPVVTPEVDELPYVDSSRPILTSAESVDAVKLGDPRNTGLMAERWQAWQYFAQHGYQCRFGGYEGGVITYACEISNNAVLLWMMEEPETARSALDLMVQATFRLQAFDEELTGPVLDGYTGDDFAGLLSPHMFRQYAIPYYEKLYAGKRTRFMHSELLRAEHLRLARDMLQITSFHGAGCVNLTLQELSDIMGHDFWTQLTPQEMVELSPQQIRERIKEFANCGCQYVQLYPGRDTPEQNLEAAIAACAAECSGGPHW